MIAILVNFHTSKSVDHYLQPHEKFLPSYVKDTTNFINKFENVKDTLKDSILVKLNEEALYTNILSHEGIEAVKETLNNQTEKPIATWVIIKFLYIIWTLNSFVFNVISKKDRAMSAIYTLTYAIIFMGKSEKLHIYPYFRNF